MKLGVVLTTHRYLLTEIEPAQDRTETLRAALVAHDGVAQLAQVAEERHLDVVLGCATAGLREANSEVLLPLGVELHDPLVAEPVIHCLAQVVVVTRVGRRRRGQ